jgi:hypothetical protein
VRATTSTASTPSAASAITTRSEAAASAARSEARMVFESLTMTTRSGDPSDERAG